jgi:hypothetical protein
MQFIKKHFLNIFFVVFIAIIFLNPLGVGMEIRSALIRLVLVHLLFQKIKEKHFNLIVGN